MSTSMDAVETVILQSEVDDVMLLITNYHLAAKGCEKLRSLSVSVCLSVGLLREHIANTRCPTSPNVRCLLHMAVARFLISLSSNDTQLNNEHYRA